MALPESAGVGGKLFSSGYHDAMFNRVKVPSGYVKIAIENGHL